MLVQVVLTNQPAAAATKNISLLSRCDQGGRPDGVQVIVHKGYAYIGQNERGRYFSEGEFEILGYPRTDGYDALTWIADQPWSNRKVGTLGCSSTAEWRPHP